MIFSLLWFVFTSNILGLDGIGVEKKRKFYYNIIRETQFSECAPWTRTRTVKANLSYIPCYHFIHGYVLVIIIIIVIVVVVVAAVAGVDVGDFFSRVLVCICAFSHILELPCRKCVVYRLSCQSCGDGAEMRVEKKNHSKREKHQSKMHT